MPRARPDKPISVYDFLDYRQFMQAVYASRRGRGGGFTFRSLAAAAGFGSPAHLKLVMDGRRALSADGARKTAAAFGLSGEEAEYFCALAAFCDAKGEEARSRAFEALRAVRRFREVRRLEVNRYEYFRRWHYVAVRELTNLDDFREDPRWISRRLGRAITPLQAGQAIRKLLRLGFLKRDRQGRLRQTEPVVHTDLEVGFGSLIMKQFHREAMKLASGSMDSCPAPLRDIRSLTVAISRSQAERIKRMNVRHMQEVLAVVVEEEPVEEIYQLNLQWFPLTKVEDRTDPVRESGDDEAG